MTAARTLAVARRVLEQLRRDPRTIALLLVVPTVLVALIKWIFIDADAVFQRVGLPLVGIFPLVSMFLVTSITMLRERSSGTLERLMSMPIAKFDLLGGYALAFALMAAVQALTVSSIAIWGLGLDVAGPTWMVLVVVVANALLGANLGLFVSAFARNEFQAVQFMPAFILPQILLCGLLVPRDLMARPLELISAFLPMTYAYDALERLSSSATIERQVWRDLAITLAVMLVALSLGAGTLRRRSD